MPTISCTEFSRQLAETIERRASVDLVSLREHAGTCDDCRAQWLDALCVDRAVAQWKRPAPTAGLTDRILSAVAVGAVPSSPIAIEVEPARHESVAAIRPRRRSTRAAGLALTALAVCVCATLLINRSLRRPEIGLRDAAQSDVAQIGSPISVSNTSKTSGTVTIPGAKQAALPKAEAPVELLVADAGSAYLHLAGDAAKAVTAASVLVPPADAALDTSPAPKADDHWVEGMRREIAPVTHQLSHAFEFLIQAVPEKRAPAT
jgi:hypothetical protein